MIPKSTIVDIQPPATAPHPVALCGDDYDHPADEEHARTIDGCREPATHVCNVFDIFTCDKHAQRCAYCDSLASNVTLQDEVAAKVGGLGTSLVNQRIPLDRNTGRPQHAWWLEVAHRLSHELRDIENEVRVLGTDKPGSRPWAPLCLAIKTSRGAERVELFLNYEDGRLALSDRPTLIDWPTSSS